MVEFAAALKKVITLLLSVIFTIFSFWDGNKAPAVEPGDVTEVKNVIFLIGDGMGLNTLRMAEQVSGNELLVLDPDHYQGIWDARGESKTRSFSNSVTDSAAGGTALACGVRVINSSIAMYYTDPLGQISVPASNTEMAKAKGMRAGVITSDDSYGATPATFSVHEINRDMSEAITRKQLECDLDLIWSAGSSYVSEDEWVDAGWIYVDNEPELDALSDPDARSYGMFNKDTIWRGTEDPDMPTLTELTVKALELLDTDNDNGFFIMIEGAHIDKNSHSNNTEGCVAACFEFDRTVAAALDFAKKDGETLVVVTADHETGDIYPEDDGVYRYHDTSHSAANVPVFVYGSKGFMKPAEVMMNVEVARRTAACMGYYSDVFPLGVSTGQTVKEAIAEKLAPPATAIEEAV